MRGGGGGAVGRRVAGEEVARRRAVGWGGAEGEVDVAGVAGEVGGGLGHEVGGDAVEGAEGLCEVSVGFGIRGGPLERGGGKTYLNRETLSAIWSAGETCNACLGDQLQISVMIRF